MTALPNIFFECDLSQVESRILYMLTGDPRMVELARIKPWEADMHTYNAALIFGTPETELQRCLALPKDDPAHKLAKEKRYLGKRTTHGAQRDMYGKRLSSNLLNEGYVYTEEQCDKLLDSYHNRFPAIRHNYFKEIRRLVMRERSLTSTWGRTLDFRYDRLEDDLFREAYSFLPQAENADLMNQWGLIPFWKWMKERVGRPPNVQVHDSLLASLPPELCYDAAVFLRDRLERPRRYAGELLSVPCEFTLGTTWAGDIDFKQLPDRDTFTDAAITVAKKIQESMV